MEAELKDILTYALGGSVPEGFVEHLIRHRDLWDAEFIRRLDELAYEFRPDLACWDICIGEDGQLHELRLPLIDSAQDG